MVLGPLEPPKYFWNHENHTRTLEYGVGNMNRRRYPLVGGALLCVPPIKDQPRCREAKLDWNFDECNGNTLAEPPLELNVNEGEGGSLTNQQQCAFQTGV